MPATGPLTAVRMSCADLAAAPFHAVPPGYSLRGYTPGAEHAWVAIHRRADRYNPSSVELFERQFGDARAELPRRQIYLLDAAGAPIGTATAWFGTGHDGRAMGRVHWVAIVPEQQGRGLAKPLLSSVCRRLAELGHRQAYLTTSTVRTPAINLYFAFGFLPELHSPQDRAAWAGLLGPAAGPTCPVAPALRQWLQAQHVEACREPVLSTPP